MKAQAVDRALSSGIMALRVETADARLQLKRSSFARAVRAFLQELERDASWIEGIVIGIVLRILDRAITRNQMEGE